MRIAAELKMGYYPTPEIVIEGIRNKLQFITPPEGSSYRFLDPCAGEGIALRQLTEEIPKADTYGIELDIHRADKARSNLDHMFPGAFEIAKIPNRNFSCLFLNPPYDREIVESEGTNFIQYTRKEISFLKEATSKLITNGILIYIVSKKIFQLYDSPLSFLMENYKDIEIYQFPKEEYESFSQVVIIAKRKSNKIKYRQEDYDYLKQHLQSDNILPDITQFSTYKYPLPLTNDKTTIITFQDSFSEKELAIEAGKSPLWNTFNDTYCSNKIKRPILPLHEGHIASLILSGFFDGEIGEGEERHIVKGKIEKYETKTVEVSNDTEIEKTRTNYRLVIKILSSDGEIQKLT